MYFPKMKIAVVTAFDESFEHLGCLAAENRQKYCRRLGYDCHILRDGFDKSRHPSWSKIKFVRRLLDSYDWVFWTDADSLIMHDAPIEPLLVDADLVMTAETYWDWITPGIRVISCGNFLARRGCQDILDDIYNQTQFVDSDWWEQMAFNHLYLDCHKYHDRVHLFRQDSFNINCLVYTPGDFLVHVTIPSQPQARLPVMALLSKFAFRKHHINQRAPLCFYDQPMAVNPYDIMAYSQAVNQTQARLAVMVRCQQWATISSCVAPSVKTMAVETDSVSDPVLDELCKHTVVPTVIVIDGSGPVKLVQEEIVAYSGIIHPGSRIFVLNASPATEYVGDARKPTGADAIMEYCRFRKECQIDLMHGIFHGMTNPYCSLVRVAV